MNRGEVWLVDLSRAEGDEIDKIRPAVIVNPTNIGILDLRIIIPFTKWENSYDSKSWLIQITPDKYNGLSDDSAADVFQVKSISTSFLTKQIGQLDSDSLAHIEWGLLLALGIASED